MIAFSRTVFRGNMTLSVERHSTLTTRSSIGVLIILLGYDEQACHQRFCFDLIEWEGSYAGINLAGIRTPFLLPSSSFPPLALPAGCINASSDTSMSSALQALNGARMRACACVEEGGPLRIFMRGLPCETPSRSSFSFRRLAPVLPSLASLWSFPCTIAFSLDSSWSSKSNSFSYRNNSRLLESWTESRERTNKNGWL